MNCWTNGNEVVESQAAHHRHTIKSESQVKVTFPEEGKKDKNDRPYLALVKQMRPASLVSDTAEDEAASCQNDRLGPQLLEHRWG